MVTREKTEQVRQQIVKAADQLFYQQGYNLCSFSDISTVSKHLSVLKDAGIVEDDKRGQQVFYRLRVPCILNFFGCVEDVLMANAKRMSSLIKL